MKRYLQKVVYCTEPQLNHKELDGEGILYITDQEKCLEMLKRRGLPVAAWLREDNKSQNLSAAFYGLESPEDLDMDFYEKVYRREKGIPWDITETDRCLVREMIPEDAEALAAIYRHPDISKYLDDFPKDKECGAQYIREYQLQYRFCEYGVWSVVEKATGNVIGRVGFSQITQDCMEGAIKDQPQFGYLIGVPWQRRGLAYEVCSAVLSYAEEALGFENVLLWTRKDNTASVQLCRKLGFAETEHGYYKYSCQG